MPQSLISPSAPETLYTVPAFPEFVSLTEVPKEIFDSIVESHPPHAAYSYLNLVIWDIFGDRKVSMLNDNLVIQRTDYDTRERFLCLLGTNKIEETLEALKAHTQKCDMRAELRFFPEEIIHQLPHALVEINEDRDNFEYIYDTSHIAEQTGSKYKKKRRQARRFEEFYPNASFRIESISDKNLQEQVIRAVYRWEFNKISNNKSCESDNEKSALSKIFISPYKESLILSSLYDGDTMIGFSIEEPLPGKFAMAHFVKADIAHKGAYEYLNEKTAQYLHSIDVRFWNWQQDLGIEGLRMAKRSYHPITYLKKYTITLK